MKSEISARAYRIIQTITWSVIFLAAFAGYIRLYLYLA